MSAVRVSVIPSVSEESGGLGGAQHAHVPTLRATRPPDPSLTLGMTPANWEIGVGASFVCGMAGFGRAKNVVSRVDKHDEIGHSAGRSGRSVMRPHPAATGASACFASAWNRLTTATISSSQSTRSPRFASASTAARISGVSGSPCSAR